MQKTRWTLSVAAAAALGATALGTSATTIRDFGTPATPAAAGLAVGGDLDGDGVPDFLARVGFVVRAFSGASGAKIRDFVGVNVPDFFGDAVAFSPDVDGDGVRDVLVGAPGRVTGDTRPGLVLLFSGANGAEMFRGAGSTSAARFGMVVLSIGDVTGDGVADFAAGGGGSARQFAGEVRAFSGADGTPISALQLTGTATDNFGASLAALGDVSGDGVPDLAVGLPGANPAPPTKPGLPRGAVEIRSGADGSLLRRIDGKVSQFGFALADAGDLDGDGKHDLAVGGEGFLAVTVYSSRTWKPIRVYPRPEGVNSFFGQSISGGIDVEGDGYPDLAIGSGATPAGSFHVFSGAPKRPTPMFDYFGGTPDAVGLPVALTPDMDGDGVGDVLSAGFFSAGGVKLVAVVPTIPEKFGFATALVRPEGGASAARGVFKMTVSGAREVVSLALSSLPSPGTAYSVGFETGRGSGAFAEIGRVTANAKGAGSLVLVGDGGPPTTVIQNVRQATGRRVVVQDADGATVLSAVLPFPGTLPPLKGAATMSGTAGTFARAVGKIATKYVPKSGASQLTVAVSGVSSKTALTLEIESAVGSGTFVPAGAFVKTKYVRDTGKGEPLPGGAASLAGLKGRAVRVMSGADVVCAGTLP